jgi:ribosomal protein S14
VGIRGGIKGRLRSLEKKSRSAFRCQECGFAPDVPGRIVIVGEGFGEVDEHDPEERCERCGRRRGGSKRSDVSSVLHLRRAAL